MLRAAARDVDEASHGGGFDDGLFDILGPESSWRHWIVSGQLWRGGGDNDIGAGEVEAVGVGDVALDGVKAGVRLELWGRLAEIAVDAGDERLGGIFEESIDGGSPCASRSWGNGDLHVE